MPPAHHKPVGAHVARMRRFLTPLGHIDLARELRGDRAGELILKIEQVLELQVEPVGPQRGLGGRVDGLDGDAKALVRPAQTAAENVAHGRGGCWTSWAGLAAQVEQEGRMPRDHHQVAEPREAGDDILGDALAEVVVAGIAGEVGQRQDRDRRMRGPVRPAELSRGAPASARRLGARVLDLEHFDRLGDILKSRLAERPQGRARHGRPLRSGTPPLTRMLLGFGHRLEARRDIDAMPEGDQFLQRHLADVQADPELDRLAVAPDRLLAKLGLDLDREPQRLPGALEQGENSIAGDVGDAAAVIANQVPEKLDRAGDLAGAPDLVMLHPSAELDHVGDHDGGARSRAARQAATSSLVPGISSPSPTAEPNTGRY